MIVLTGESHLGAIRRGTADRDDVTYWPLGMGGSVATPFFTHDVSANAVTTTVSGWRNRTFTKDTLTFGDTQALVGLSMPLNTSRILRDYSWDTHVPWHLKKSDTEAPLSDAVVQATIAQDSDHAVAFVAALQACGIDVVVIEAPHFFESSPYLERMRLDVCAYVDALYRTTVRAKLAAMGVDVIDQPPQTLTPLGSTKAEFSHETPKDTYHASRAFGAMIFKDIIAYGTKAGFL